MEPKNTPLPPPKTLAELAAQMNWGAGSRSSNPNEDRYFAGGVPAPEQEVTSDDIALLAEMFSTRDTTPRMKKE
jgi:hypothetical protein